MGVSRSSGDLSFKRAAQKLRRDATIVSKRVNSLETRLGVRLVERTTRRVALTEAGSEYLERARAILRAIEEADREAATHAKGEPRGHLRLSSSRSRQRMVRCVETLRFRLAVRV